MAKTVEELLQENNELMRNFIQSQGGNRTPPSNSGGSSSGGTGSGSLGDYGQRVYTAGLDSLGKVATGMYTVNNAADDVGKVLGAIPLAGGLLQKGFGSITSTMLVYNETMNDAGKYGMGFNNNIGQMAESMLGARMSIAEFQDTMHRAGPVIMGFGGSASSNAQTLLKLDQAVQESAVGRNLKLTGVSAKELNEVMLLTSFNQRNINIQDQAQVDAMAEHAGALAKELDMNARLFGKSREQQQKDIQAQQEKANVQAALDQMDTGARMRFQDLQGKIGTLGPKFQDLTSDIVVNGGARNAESTRLIAILGNAGSKYQEAVLNYQNATTPAAKEAAARELEVAKAAVARRMAEKDFVDAARYNTGEVGKLAGDVRTQNAEFQVRRAAEEKVFKDALAKNETLTAQEADIRIKKIMTDTKSTEALEQEILARKNKEKEQDPAKAAALLMNGLNDRVKDVSAGLGTVMKEAIQKSSSEILKEKDNRDALNKVLLGVTQRESSAKINSELKGSSLNAATNVSAEYAKSKTIPQKSKGSPTIPGFLNGSGDFNSLFENFGSGTLNELHGQEVVARPEQLKGIVSKMMSNMQKAAPQMEQSMSNISGQLGSMADNMSSQMSPMANQMASQVSSMAKATLDDVTGELISLNKHIVELINHNVELVRNSSKTQRTIASNGNRLSA